MLRLISVAAGLFLSVAAPSMAAAAAPNPLPALEQRRVGTAQDVAQIERILADFMRAIETKDAKLLSSLVLHSRINFSIMLDQTQVDTARKYDANFDGLPQGGFGRFAQFIATTPKSIAERFLQPKIIQDGPFATVFFDYEFVEDGVVSNYGVEQWQLHKADGAWKIFSVVWTQHDVPAAPPAK